MQVTVGGRVSDYSFWHIIGSHESLILPMSAATTYEKIFQSWSGWTATTLLLLILDIYILSHMHRSLILMFLPEHGAFHALQQPTTNHLTLTNRL